MLPIPAWLGLLIGVAFIAWTVFLARSGRAYRWPLAIIVGVVLLLGAALLNALQNP